MNQTLVARAHRRDIGPAVLLGVIVLAFVAIFVGYTLLLWQASADHAQRCEWRVNTFQNCGDQP